MKFNEITARALEKAARQQFDLARDYMDLGARQVQLLNETKDPQKWLQSQSQMATEFGEKMMARAQELVELATQTQKDVTVWMEETSKKVVPPAQ